MKTLRQLIAESQLTLPLDGKIDMVPAAKALDEYADGIRANGWGSPRKRMNDFQDIKLHANMLRSNKPSEIARSAKSLNMLDIAHRKAIHYAIRNHSGWHAAEHYKGLESQ